MPIAPRDESSQGLRKFTLRIALFLAAYFIAFAAGVAFCGIFIFQGDIRISSFADFIRLLPLYFIFPFEHLPVTSGTIGALTAALALLGARKGSAAVLGLARICSCWFNPVCGVTVLSAVDILAGR